MTVVAARELRDGEIVFVGIGLPNLACNLARATHAPGLVLIYEFEGRQHIIFHAQIEIVHFVAAYTCANKFILIGLALHLEH